MKAELTRIETISSQAEEKSRNSSEERVGIKVLFPYLREHTGGLIVAAALSVVIALATVTQPFIVQEALDRIASGDKVFDCIVAFIGIVVLAAVSEAAQYYTLNRTAEEAVFSLRSAIVTHVLRLPMRAYQRLRDGDIAARVTSDTTLFRTAITSGAIELIGSSLTAAAAIVGMTIIDPALSLIVLAILLSSVALSLFVGRTIQVSSAKAQSSVGGLAADVSRSMSAIQTIRASNATHYETERLRAHARSARSAGLRMARVSSALIPANRISTQVAFAVILAVGGSWVLNGAIDIPDLVALVMLLFLLISPLGQLVRAYMAVQTALGAVGRIDAVLSSDTENEQPQIGIQIPVVGLDVQFEDVHFSYRPEAPLLKGVSLDVQPGELCAIVGDSGAGKSTLLALLERFYDPAFGTIRLGGADISMVSRSEVRDRLALVDQGSTILAGTIRENLVLGGHDITDYDCREALAKTRLEHLVGVGTNGLNSAVGEGGKLLSGGERQRLAIARALATKKPVLLLDEPSSSLDEANASLLHDLLRDLGPEHTVLIVTHRLSTMCVADRIYRLADGRIRKQDEPPVRVPARRDGEDPVKGNQLKGRS